jgi:hypothetical protein
MRFPVRSRLTTALCSLVLLCATASFAHAESYGEGFANYWKKAFGKQDTMVLGVLGFGALCILVLLSSGKWSKDKG